MLPTDNPLAMLLMQGQSIHRSEPILPARIQVALNLLSMLSNKTDQKVAAHGVGIEILPGQKLTHAEANALATACNVLNDYMAGKLLPDIWESESLEMKKPRQFMVVGCPQCTVGAGIVDQGCSLCKGSGKVSITAA